MATWPTYAKLIVAGYGEEADYGVLRTEMDNGIAKQRSRFSTPIVTRDATVIAKSLADKQALDAWIASDLAGGAAWFAWIEPLTKNAVQARLVGGKLKWGEPQGPIWQATCKIETLGR
ncbi:hypothetical protein ABRZ04_04555 [Castellaniella ginsengisoli]|uniref:Phage tail protein n=1 Tax=Castellaniella ginsengisoli TaxID=546114 RepID=A0AB39D2E6_9BURK